MSASSPHFLLYSDCDPPSREELGRWRFVLQSSDGSHRLEANDQEPDTPRSRLELLSVIRGLEALDQPSRVTLVTSSRYVGGGLRHGLEQWRLTDFQWDHFGVMSPIKNEDLWRRIDQALEYHSLECRVRKGANVPQELERRFQVRSQSAVEESRGPLCGPTPGVHSADRTTPLATEPESARSTDNRTRVPDPHWPRRKGRTKRFAACLGTAAATVTGLLLLRG